MQRLGTLSYIKYNFPLCMLSCFCCQDIRFQISLIKSTTLLLKSLVGNNVTFGNRMFFQNSQSKHINSLDAQHLLTDVVTTSVYIPENYL